MSFMYMQKEQTNAYIGEQKKENENLTPTIYCKGEVGSFNFLKIVIRIALFTSKDPHLRTIETQVNSAFKALVKDLTS